MHNIQGQNTAFSHDYLPECCKKSIIAVVSGIYFARIAVFFNHKLANLKYFVFSMSENHNNNGLYWNFMSADLLSFKKERNFFCFEVTCCSCNYILLKLNYLKIFECHLIYNHSCWNHNNNDIEPDLLNLRTGSDTAQKVIRIFSIRF